MSSDNAALSWQGACPACVPWHDAAKMAQDLRTSRDAGAPQCSEEMAGLDELPVQQELWEAGEEASSSESESLGSAACRASAP